MEFWNDISTQKSWEILKKLNKKLNFIVIGGWNIYLWTHAQKSKDIDFILTKWEDLDKIKKTYELKKNDRLKEYEIIIDEIDVDIYLPHYSRFPIPGDQLIKMTTNREGFTVLKTEPLMILKQQAHKDRKDSIKGLKDRVDILSILLSNMFNYAEYQKILKNYELEEFQMNLTQIIKNAKEEFKYLHILNPRKIKQLKEEWIKNLK
jgi:hypothetical protein